MKEKNSFTQTNHKSERKDDFITRSLITKVVYIFFVTSHTALVIMASGASATGSAGTGASSGGGAGAGSTGASAVGSESDSGSWLG